MCSWRKQVCHQFRRFREWAGGGELEGFRDFRIDGLPPGRYTLVLRAEDGTEVATRDLELADRFLFEQNLDSNKP